MAMVGAFAFWLVFQQAQDPEEMKRARRQFLGGTPDAWLDGMSLDVCKVEAKDGHALTMLIYSYRIGGVDYECAPRPYQYSGIMS